MKLQKPMPTTTTALSLGVFTNSAFAQSNATPEITFNTPSENEVSPTSGEILVDVSAFDSGGSITFSRLSASFIKVN